jgi:hypothetical protein
VEIGMILRRGVVIQIEMNELGKFMSIINSLENVGWCKKGETCSSHRSSKSDPVLPVLEEICFG